MAGSLVVYRWGTIEFSVPEGTITDLDRQTRYRIDRPDPIEGLGVPKMRGPSSDDMTFRGVIFPGISGTLRSVQRVRDAADKGESNILTDGEGEVYGNWLVESVNERQSALQAGGKPRRIEYEIAFVRDPEGLELPL